MTSCARRVLRLVGSPNLAAKSWVTDQYDRYVLGNTVLAQPADAGVIRVDEESGLGVAMATDGNGRWCKLDPYLGAQLALSEAYRNVAVTGARPLAVTDCLNFGSPEDPDVMWQFAETTRGLADACLEMGVPVTGGNVSFYNQTADAPINPTPVIGVLGVIDDVTRRTPMAPRDGQVLLLLGDDPRRARRLGMGTCRARPPRRAPAAARPRGGDAAGRRARVSLARPAARRGARRERRRPGPVPRRDVARRRRRRAGRRCPRVTRSPRCSASRWPASSSPSTSSTSTRCCPAVPTTASRRPASVRSAARPSTWPASSPSASTSCGTTSDGDAARPVRLTRALLVGEPDRVTLVRRRQRR